MTTDYNKIARDYQLSKSLPFRECIEWYTYRQLLGDVSGFRILDLACGEGFYSRRVKQLGAASVIGVDASEKMIDLAKHHEANQPMDIDYVVGDANNLVVYGGFDMVIASYLLNYAQTRMQLVAFCRTIAANLNVRGRFVSINNNPYQPPRTFETCRQYGFNKSLSGPLVEGAAITYEFFRDGHAFRFDNYYLSRATHGWAFQKAGLTVPHWHAIAASPECIKRYGKAYWQDFLTYAPIVGIESRRASDSHRPLANYREV